MSDEPVVLAPKVKWRLEKRDADGNIFEITEGGDGEETRVVFSKPGEPTESYVHIEERA